jgi:hypothetical protein
MTVQKGLLENKFSSNASRHGRDFVIHVYYLGQTHKLLLYALVSLKIQNTYTYQIHNLGGQRLIYGTIAGYSSNEI